MRASPRRRALAVAFAMAAAGTACAQSFPTKSIRFVVNFTPGGGTDLVARAMGPEFTRSLGQQVVVENRAGANGNIGADLVAKSPPDGYTVLVTTNAPIVINPHLYAKLPFDPLVDLAPVSQVATLPFVLVTHPSVPARSIADLIALARSTPKGLTFGSSGTGGGAHLAGEMVKGMTRANMIHVPYKGSAPAMTGLLSGEVDFMFVSILAVTPLIKDNRLRAIAVSSAARNKALPNVPAMSEFPALKGAESDLWYGMLVAGGTDRKVVEVLAKEVRRILALPEFRERFEPSGTVLVGDSPESFGRTLRNDFDRWKGVVKAAGARTD